MQHPILFLDSGNPDDTKTIITQYPQLGGQTTNPTLVSKNPHMQTYLAQGKKLTNEELIAEYKQIVQQIQQYCSTSISVEVYADWNTPVSHILEQANNIATWGKHIHVKFPAIPNGLEAAHQFVSEGGRANMTLVFDQYQAAAAYVATLGAQHAAYVSPFIARWDDRGYRGLDFLRNIVDMYTEFDATIDEIKPHIQILAASIRTLDQLYGAMTSGADIITIPPSLFLSWIAEGKKFPDKTYASAQTNLQEIPYDYVSYNTDFHSYPIQKVNGSLLDEGLRKFIKDWKSLIG